MPNKTSLNVSPPYYVNQLELEKAEMFASVKPLDSDSEVITKLMKRAMHYENNWKRTNQTDFKLFEKSFDYFHNAARKGNSVAMYKVAKMLLIASDHSKDENLTQFAQKKALHWCRLSASKNCRSGMYLLAVVLRKIWEDSKQTNQSALDESIMWFKEVILVEETDNPLNYKEICTQIGELYKQKQDIEKNLHLKSLYLQCAIDAYGGAIISGSAEAGKCYQELESKKIALEKSRAEAILARSIPLDAWQFDESEDGNFHRIIPNYVSRFLHPFITGEITAENEIAGRASMIDLLFSGFKEAGYPFENGAEAKILRIALDAYLMESLKAKYIQMNNIYELRAKRKGHEELTDVGIRKGSAHFNDVIQALEIALVKDFPRQFLFEQGLLERENLIEMLGSVLKDFSYEFIASDKDAFSYPRSGNRDDKIAKAQRLNALSKFGIYFLGN